MRLQAGADGDDLIPVAIHVETQELQPRASVEGTAEEVREHDVVQLPAFEFTGEALENVGAGLEARNPVEESTAPLRRGDRRRNFERLPGTVDNCFDGKAPIGIRLERRRRRSQGAINLLDTGMLGEDEMLKVLGNRPLARVRLPCGLGVAQPCYGGQHTGARRFNFRKQAGNFAHLPPEISPWGFFWVISSNVAMA